LCARLPPASGCHPRACVVANFCSRGCCQCAHRGWSARWPLGPTPNYGETFTTPLTPSQKASCDRHGYHTSALRMSLLDPYAQLHPLHPASGIRCSGSHALQQSHNISFIHPVTFTQLFSSLPTHPLRSYVCRCSTLMSFPPSLPRGNDVSAC